MTRRPVNRPCPLTGQPAARVLAYAPASAIAAGNATYREGYAEILGISPDDEFPFAEGPGGFVYAGWSPPSDFLRRLYEDVIDHSRTATTTIAYRQSLLDFAAAFLRLVVRGKGADAPLRLLDFGCGYGALLQILASRDIVSVGYEPSAERGARTADGGFPVFSDIEAVKAEGPFDLIVCTEVLEHLPDPRQALRLFKALAAPGALVAVTVPHCDAATVDRALGLLAAEGRLPAVFNPWEHLNYFSPASLRLMLVEEGFEIVPDYAAAASIHAAAARVGEAAAMPARLLSGARLLKQALTARPSTQLFCRSVTPA